MSNQAAAQMDNQIDGAISENERLRRTIDRMNRTMSKKFKQITALKESRDYWMRKAAPAPEGCTPADAKMLRAANHKLAQKLHELAAQAQAEPVAFCALSLDGRRIAHFDGRLMVMPGPVGNDCHPSPLYTAPPAVKAEPQWMPIETAPKDGTRILLHPAIEVHDTCSKGHWSEVEKQWITDGAPSGVAHTHWMPTPTSPAAQKGGAA